MNAQIYITRHERHEAIEAYADRLSDTQKAYLRDNEGDFWLRLSDGTSQLLLIEDEG